MRFSPALLLFIGFVGMSFGFTAGVFLDGGWVTGAFNLALLAGVAAVAFFLSRAWRVQAHRLRGIGIRPIPVFFEFTMAVFGVLLLLHVLGDGDGSLGSELYRRIEGYDTALHALAGLAFGASVLCVRMPSSRLAVPLLALAGAIGVGIAWEIFEIIIDQFMTLRLWGGPADMALDILADILGGLFAGLAALWYYEHYYPGGKQLSDQPRNLTK